jgi:hypothetical protein
MSISLSQEKLSFNQRFRTHFFDLNLFQHTVLGGFQSTKRNLWLFGCYIFFVLGILSRQLVVQKETHSVNVANFNFSTLLASFIIGLAVFPFAIRIIARIVKRIFEIEPLKQPKRKVEGFNIIHLAASFGIGYFFNLLIQKIPELIAGIGI